MWLASAAVAFGAEIGSSTAFFDYTDEAPDGTAIHLAVSATDGGVWVAVEWAQDKAVLTDGNLDLFYSADDFASASRRILSEGRKDSTMAMMYPAIHTWSGATNVTIAGKEDVEAGQQSQLEIFRVDRAAIETAPITSSPIDDSVADTVEHGRMHLLSDYNSAAGEQAVYVCYTTHDTAVAGADDVLSKAKLGGEPYTDRDVKAISADNDPYTDDHCQQDFTSEGRRFTAYHSDKSGDDQIWIGIDQFNLVNGRSRTAPPIALLSPPIEPLLDFPSLSISGETDNNDMLVVAQNPNRYDRLVWWDCLDGAWTDCDSSEEWGEGEAADVPGNYVLQPEALATPDDRFVLYETVETNGENSIGILSMCGSAASFTFEGEVQKPSDGVDPYEDCSWSYDKANLPGSSVAQLEYDATTQTLHAVFVCAQGIVGDARRWVPVHWTIDVALLCPAQ